MLKTIWKRLIKLPGPATFGQPNFDSLLHSTPNLLLVSKKDLDWSKYPQLLENDLEEHFMRGGGPGGQAVAKTNNCVQLKHMPTGLVVKCHETRSLDQNRKLARELLEGHLDDFLNGTESISAQKNRLLNKKRASNESRAEKLRERKKAFKEMQQVK